MSTDRDTLQRVVEIYLDGVTTGVASVLVSRFPDVAAEQRDQIAQATVDAMRGDPLVMEAIEAQILERLAGVDSGPKDITTYGGEVDG